MIDHAQVLKSLGIKNVRIAGVRHFTDGKPAQPAVEKPPRKYTPQEAKGKTTTIVDAVLNLIKWPGIEAFEDAGLNTQTAKDELNRRIKAGTVKEKIVNQYGKKAYSWAKVAKCGS